MELVWGLNAERYSILPFPGTLREQPAGTLRNMNHAVSVYRHMSAYFNADSRTQWAKNNPQAWEFVASVRKLQKERDNGNQ